MFRFWPHKATLTGALAAQSDKSDGLCGQNAEGGGWVGTWYEERAGLGRSNLLLVSAGRITDISHLVVVPAKPGPLLPLAQVDRNRSEVDEILDDLFGDVDDDGPGTTDAVLLAGGAAAIVASQVVALPAIVLFGGFAGVGLGSVLPIRSGLRRLKGKRRDSKIQSLIGDGRLLNKRPAPIKELVAAHQQAIAMSDDLPEFQQIRVRNAAHGLVTEVAMLLDGHELSTDAEDRYATDRLDSLRNLLVAVEELKRKPDDGLRQASAEARMQLDAEVGSTALDEAALLAADLRIEHDR